MKPFATKAEVGRLISLRATVLGKSGDSYPTARSQKQVEARSEDFPTPMVVFVIFSFTILYAIGDEG